MISATRSSPAPSTMQHAGCSFEMNLFQDVSAIQHRPPLYFKFDRGRQKVLASSSWSYQAHSLASHYFVTMLINGALVHLMQDPLSAALKSFTHFVDPQTSREKISLPIAAL